DEPVRFLKGKLRLRQVTRLCDSGHQTNVITSRWDLRHIEGAYRSSVGGRRTSSSTCEKTSCLTRSSITRSIRKILPAPSPIPSAGLWIRAARAEVAKLER